MPTEESAPLGRGTLARQLVVRSMALVAVVSVLLSLFTTLGVRQLLIRQLDDQLDSAVSLQAGGGGQQTVCNGKLTGLGLPGQQNGTLVVIISADGVCQGVLRTVPGRPSPIVSAPSTAVDRAVTVQPGQRTTMLLPGLGRYRLKGEQRFDGRVVVVGLPQAGADQLLAYLITLEAVLVGLALLVSGAVAYALVVRSLRPLRRLTTTARQVSQMELDRGDVDLSIRVPEADAEPGSEVGDVAQAFNRMLGNVETALTARQASETKLRQFVADASHELRNPLASIRGYAELTRRHRDQLPDDVGFSLTRIESESTRMSALVEDLFLLARLDSGPALTPSPVDLTELVVNAVSDARAAGPDHRWQLDLTGEPVTVLGDPHRLHQVVVNLLANARTHTPPGTTVWTSLRVEPAAAVPAGSAPTEPSNQWPRPQPQPPQAVVTVADNGPGVPPEIQPRVFERFTRADVSRARSAQGGQSTGLGLAIVAAVVGAHGGRVSVASRPGDTRFEIRLPLMVGPSN